MGCISERDTDDAQIQAKEYLLQIILCTVPEIRSGYICLDEGDFITKSKVKLGFENMHNSLSAALTKQETVLDALNKFTFPFLEEGTDQYSYKDLLLALFVNSKSNTSEKATGIAELYFRDKSELNQADIVFLFKKLFKSVLSYSFSLIGKYEKEHKEFDKPKSQEEEEKAITKENEQLLLLKTGDNLAVLIGESIVEKDKTIIITEFAEKCKTFLPDRFYRDIFIPKALRTSVRREYNNNDQVDKVKDEKVAKEKKEKEEKEKKEKEEKEKQEKEEKEKKEKEEKDKKEQEEKDKKEKEEKEKKDKEEKEKNEKEEKGKKQEKKE